MKPISFAHTQQFAGGIADRRPSGTPLLPLPAFSGCLAFIGCWYCGPVNYDNTFVVFSG